MFKNVKDWMTNHFLLLHSDKTEILLIGPKQYTESCRLQFASKICIKNLGVILDSNLSFENHMSHATKTAFFHLRKIAKLQNMLPVSDAEKLVHAFMISRLDYCNELLAGCPASSINNIQVVQNTVARLLTRSRKYDHSKPVQRIWGTINLSISYKI